MSVPLSVFSDYACPWCYLGWGRLRGLRDTHDLEVRVVHFPLSPDTPAEGRAVRPYLEAKGIDVDAATTRLSALLAAEGLPYHGDADTLRTWNTRRAQELASWATARGDATALHDALFHAYHVDNVNLADPTVLLEVAASAGLEGPDVEEAVASRAGTDAVDACWQEARQVGVRSVPTFVAAGRGVVGAQPTDVLERLVRLAAEA